MRRLTLCSLIVSLLAAAEHRGVARFHNRPVPGVSVRATQGSRHVTTVTDSSGYYSIPELAAGAWTFRIEMQCFLPIERQVQMAPDAPPAAWDLELLPEQAIVAAATVAPPPAVSEPTPAPPPPPVAPAAKPAPARTVDPAAAEAAVASAADSYLVNGSVNNSSTSPLSQSAAFGNVRKNNASPYRFAVSATVGNALFDARPYSLTGFNRPKAGYNQTQGAVSLGGPLGIPRLLPLRRDRGYLFLSYQWVRNRTATNQAGLMPTSAERDGDLSQTRGRTGDPVHFTDPATAAIVPDNRIPASRISPQARALLALFPTPNAQGNRDYNYETTLRGTTASDTIQSTIYNRLTGKDTLISRFRWQRTAADTPNLFDFLDTARGRGLNTSLVWSRRITNRIFGNLQVDYSRLANTATPFFARLRNVSGDAGISGNNQEPVNWGPPSLTFSSGLAGLDDGQYAVTRNQTTGAGASLFWMHGEHTIQTGASLHRQQFNTLGQENPRGAFGFTGASTGSDLASLLFGLPDAARIAFGNADKYLRTTLSDAYLNDDWRLRPSLTINAGLRWEYTAPITERYGRLVNLDIARDFTAATPVIGSAVTGTAFPPALLRPDRLALQPRLGLAWRPFAVGSLLVRAGYGIYYDNGVYQSIATRMTQQPPLSTSFSIPGSADNPLTLATGFRTPGSSLRNTFAVDPRFQIGYSQNWQFKLQHDLPQALVLSAAYLGTKGTRAQQQFLPNTYPTGAANPCPACPASFTYLASNGNATRHAAQLQLRRRMRKGLLATLDYTWAKAIDNASLGGRGEGTAVIAQDWLNLRGERGLSTFDQRHLVTLDTQYTTGIETLGGTLLRGWRGKLFGGWSLAASLKAGTGLPLMPFYAAVVQGTGVIGSIRPDFTGAPLYDAPAGRFLNPAAVTAPLPGHWGNAGRNTITGPAQFGLNSSLSRSFHEGRFEARADGDNVLNRVVYRSWNTGAAGTQFGIPTAANAMRTLRITFRVRF